MSPLHASLLSPPVSALDQSFGQQASPRGLEANSHPFQHRRFPSPLLSSSPQPAAAHRPGWGGAGGRAADPTASPCAASGLEFPWKRLPPALNWGADSSLAVRMPPDTHLPLATPPGSPRAARNPLCPPGSLNSPPCAGGGGPDAWLHAPLASCSRLLPGDWPFVSSPGQVFSMTHPLARQGLPLEPPDSSKWGEGEAVAGGETGKG